MYHVVYFSGYLADVRIYRFEFEPL